MVVAQFVKGINEEIDKLVRIRELLISLEYGEQGPTPEEMVKRRVEHNNNNKRRHFSKAARHKMAMAQKARWALLKGKK